MVGKQKILIVDDDENIAELISLYLTKECFDTKIVYNGEDALTAFESYQPNLILLDLMLPESTAIRSAGRSAPVLPRLSSCSQPKVKSLIKSSDWNSALMITS